MAVESGRRMACGGGNLIYLRVMKPVLVRRQSDARRNVVLALLLSNVASQRKLAGVFAHLGANSDWNVRILRSQEEADRFFGAPDGFTADGVVYSTGALTQACLPLARSKAALVVMDEDPPALRSRKSNLAVIRVDPAALAKAAADLFAHDGLRSSYAFVHPVRGMDWAERRETAFRSALPPGTPLFVLPARGDSPARDAKRLADFLLRLPKPAALLAANDARAADVIAAAEAAGLSVPKDVAVLGIDNDPYVCDRTSPAISSVEPDSFHEGRTAAETLDRLMRAESPLPAMRLDFGVKRIVLRESTGFVTPASRLVARVADLIASEAANGLRPSDVPPRLGVSRTLINLRLREAGMPSIARQIATARFAEAKRLLHETQTPVSQIPALCGAANANAFRNAFRREFGHSLKSERMKFQ